MRHNRPVISMAEDLLVGDGDSLKQKDLLMDPSESPFDMAAHAETRARVEEALRQVPEPYRTTLILRDIEGFLYEEVAEIQGVNLGTVKSRLVRGRAALKTILSAPSVPAQAYALHVGLQSPLGEETQ